MKANSGAKKKTLLIVIISLFCFNFGVSQTTILNENFGTTTNFPVGWSSSGTHYWFASISSTSSGYPGASGSNHIRTEGSSTKNATLTFSDELSTEGFTNITVLWGARRTSTQDEVIFEWSTDGSNWNNVSFIDVSSNSTWALVNGGTRIQLPSTAENVSNLRFRWIINNCVSYRIDDFTVQGIDVTLSAEPVSQVASFSAANISATELTLSFSAPSTIANTTGYLILYKIGSNPAGIPEDTSIYTAGDIIGDAKVAAVITNIDATSVSITGLFSDSNYNFTIVPFNHNEPSPLTYNYYTDVIRLLSNVNTLAPTKTTDFFRTKQTGYWRDLSTWLSSADNIIWQNSSLVPDNNASGINIVSGYTISIDTNVNANDIVINGILTFDGVNERNISARNITITSTGSFITQSSGAFTNTLTLTGDLTNNGTFDMAKFGANLNCIVVFNKNGNQFISGSGVSTNFSYIIIDMGSSNSNILEINSSNFSACSNFLNPTSGIANNLKNGTLKLSGSYNFSGTFFQQSSTAYTIVSTAGIWLNNANVNITSYDDSYEVKGLLRNTNGTLNIGNSTGNSLKYFNSSVIIIEGGYLNIAGRFSPDASNQKVTYTQTGGEVTLVKVGSNTSVSKRSNFEITPGSLFNWSGGKIILQNGRSKLGGYDYCNESSSSNITGGILQFGNSNSALINKFYIYSSNPIPNLDVKTYNSPKIYLFSNIIISGDISIEANATIDSQTDPDANAYEVENTGSTLYTSSPISYNLNIGGDYSNSGTFLGRDKRVKFNGTDTQNISGTSIFYDFEIDNPNGVLINSSTTIDNNLTFTSGNIITSANNYLIFAENASVSGVSDNSHVYGPVQKITNSDTKFIFPVGDGTVFRSIALTPSDNNSTTWTAQYTSSGYENQPVSGIINHVSAEEYWNIDRSGSANAKIELSWDVNSQADANYTDLVVAHFNGINWESAGGTNHSGNASNGTLESNSGWSSYSPFTLGSITPNNPLPVSLTSFTATCSGDNTTRLDWSTLSETNNDYFSIEKSVDGVNFQSIGKVSGSGNSNSPINYSFVDIAKPEITFYRLKQTDYDGGVTFSEPVSSTCKNHENTFTVLPNSTEGITLLSELSESGIYYIIIVDNIGRILYNKSRFIESGAAELNIKFGLYSNQLLHITIFNDNFKYFQNFILNH